MQRNKERPFDFRLRYKRTLEISFIIALLFLCSLFFSFQKHETSFELPYLPLNDIIIKVIPPTTQPPERPPQPDKPSVLVEDDDQTELQADESLDIFKFDPTQEIEPAPEEQIEHVFNSWELSQEPKIKFRALPIYPEIAKKAWIEGRVVVEVIISKKGDVIEAKITTGIPMLNDAALEAAKKCTFFPAKQRDKYVKVKMSIPFDFRLN